MEESTPDPDWSLIINTKKVKGKLVSGRIWTHNIDSGNKYKVLASCGFGFNSTAQHLQQMTSTISHCVCNDDDDCRQALSSYKQCCSFQVFHEKCDWSGGNISLSESKGYQKEGLLAIENYASKFCPASAKMVKWT